MDREADDRRHADPEQPSRPLGRGVVGRADHHEGHEVDRGAADEADGKLPARAVEGEPEDWQHGQDAVGRVGPSVGRAEERDDDEESERRQDLREVREAVPREPDGTENDQSVDDRRREERVGLLSVRGQRIDEHCEPHRAEKGQGPGEQALALEGLESRLVDGRERWRGGGDRRVHSAEGEIASFWLFLDTRTRVNSGQFAWRG
jgi:hypothetical protein